MQKIKRTGPKGKSIPAASLPECPIRPSLLPLLLVFRRPRRLPLLDRGLPPGVREFVPGVRVRPGGGPGRPDLIDEPVVLHLLAGEDDRDGQGDVADLNLVARLL